MTSAPAVASGAPEFAPRPPAPMTAIRMSALRPLVADWIASVPADRRFPDRFEDTHAGRGRLGHFDHCSGMTFVQKIDEGAAGRVALLTDLPATLHLFSERRSSRNSGKNGRGD